MVVVVLVVVVVVVVVAVAVAVAVVVAVALVVVVVVVVMVVVVFVVVVVVVFRFCSACHTTLQCCGGGGACGGGGDGGAGGGGGGGGGGAAAAAAADVALVCLHLTCVPATSGFPDGLGHGVSPKAARIRSCLRQQPCDLLLHEPPTLRGARASTVIGREWHSVLMFRVQS